MGKDSFLTSFKDFLLFLLTFFTPWSAINLVDYYLISRERYDIPALSDPGGVPLCSSSRRCCRICAVCLGYAARVMVGVRDS